MKPSTSPSSMPVSPPVAIFLNAGSFSMPLFVDSNSSTWGVDDYFMGGSGGGIPTSISRTVDDRLYQTFREGEFTYQIPVPDGVYDVRLHFADLKYVWCDKI